MRVVIDARFASSPVGLGRYTRELVGALTAREDQLEYVVVVRDDPSSWLSPRIAHHMLDVPHYSFAEQRRLPNLLRTLRADLLFSTHFNVPWRCPVPFVATIHDLILHRYPNSAPPLKRVGYKLLMHRTVRKAAHLIAVSEYTRQEIARTYGSGTLGYTTRIYEGVTDAFCVRSPQEQLDVRQRHGLQKEFFLYVGSAKEHKNVQMLIEAFLAADTGKELVLVTGGRESEELRVGPGVRVLRGVEDADLPALYSAAAATVTASLYEGFGLPILEALHCGCPVIATDRTSILEVAQGKALLVEPTVEAFVDALRNPPQERPVIADRWTWQEAARQTALLLRSFA